MTYIPDHMATKPPTLEVLPSAGERVVSNSVVCGAVQGEGGQWLVEIRDGETAVKLTAVEAQMIAEFIAMAVRKRW